MQLHLGGHLSWYDEKKRSEIEIRLTEPAALSELVDRLRLPRAEVALVAVNGNLVALEEVTVSDSDRVELYPPVGGGTWV